MEKDFGWLCSRSLIALSFNFSLSIARGDEFVEAEVEGVLDIVFEISWRNALLYVRMEALPF